MQNRLKSKPMWVGIISALFLAYNSVAENFGLPTVLDGTAEIVVNFVFATSAAFSAINNPTNPKGL